MQDDRTIALDYGDSANRDGYAGKTWRDLEIIERVGAGGFGEVFRAWDPRLQRQVALKLHKLSPAEQDTAYTEILSEARALAQVRHPNVVAVHGVDRTEDRVGYWTDFIQGRTLAQLLREQGLLGPREAALAGIEVAKALSAVHSAGLLHRDVKLENVMREEGGRIVLLDFGLSAVAGKDHCLAGTPSYMAPELFRGEPCSVVADIYALGVLLFYAVSGRFPVDITTVDAAAAAVRFSSPKLLLDIRPDLPQDFTRVVAKAIDPDPRRRFATAGEFLVALSDTIASEKAPAQKKTRLSLAAIASLVLLAAIAAAVWPHFHAVQTAVAPDSDEAYLKAQHLLSRYDDPKNLDAAETLFHDILKRDPHNGLAEAGLGRAALLRYRWEHDPKLLDVAQKDSQAALQMNANAAPADITLASVYTTRHQSDLAAKYAQAALHLDNRDPEAIEAEADQFDAAGQLADAETDYRRTIDLAPDDWRWPVTLGFFFYEHNRIADAADQFKHATALSPDNALAWNDLGAMYTSLGRFSEAEAALKQAVKIRPNRAALNSLASVLTNEGRYAEAIPVLQQAVEKDQSYYLSWANLGAVYKKTGDAAKASQTYREACRLAEADLTSSPDDAALIVRLATYYAELNDAGRAIKLLRRATALSPDNADIAYRAARVFELLHDRTGALQMLGKAVRLGFTVSDMQTDYEMAGLFADLHVAAVVKQNRTGK